MSNAAFGLLHVLAVSANAPIDQLDIELGFDVTVDQEVHPFFQNFLSDESPLPKRSGRLLDVDATIGLLQAVDASPHADRLHRAMDQYALALGHWRLGRETLALAFIYMGMEGLSKVAVREHGRRRQVDEAELARQLGVDPVPVPHAHSCPRCASREWRNSFEAAVRRKLLFQGDDDCYQQAPKASDGFEHGYESFTQLRALASAARDRAARYLREAIFDLASLNESSRAALLGPAFAEPAGPWPITSYIWGNLIGPTDMLAATGYPYPFIERNALVKAVTRDETGHTHIEVDHTMRVAIGEGVQFRPERYEVWGPVPQPGHVRSNGGAVDLS